MVDRERESPAGIAARRFGGSMANALIVRETFLPSSRKPHRAAQYVRMSTDYQRYCPICATLSTGRRCDFLRDRSKAMPG
jgi:hypothetical protein